MVVGLACLDEPKSYADGGFIASSFRACLFTLQVADLKNVRTTAFEEKENKSPSKSAIGHFFDDAFAD